MFRVRASTQVRVKRKKRATSKVQPVSTCDGGIPGTQSVFVKTWGCSHNNSDSEYMAGLLSQYGYNIILDEANSVNADLWLLNSCTVKNPSEEKFSKYRNKAESLGKKVVVAGCVPQGEQEKYENYSIVGVQQIDRVVEVVETTLQGYTCRYVGSKRTEDETGKKKKRKAGGASLHLPKIRKNPLIEIISINTGCLNQCTYCKTKHARGNLGSYPVEEICKRVRSVVEDEGVKEIWLTSEDVGAYGLDIGTNIAELLNMIADTIENTQHPDGTKVMIRVGMTNPPYIKNHMEAIKNILLRPNFYEWLHLPVQSGSDDVLEDMKRKYYCKDFEKLCDYMIEHIPTMHIMTDFIAGFPTEQPHHHEESMRLLRKYQFRSLNISQFYPRPGTPAARMKKLPTKTVKERSREMTKYFRSYFPYKDRVGKIYDHVLVTQLSSKSKEDFVGHNKQYDHIIIRGRGKDYMGCTLKVKIVEVGRFHQIGEVLDTLIENENAVWFRKKLLLSTLCAVTALSVASCLRR